MKALTLIQPWATLIAIGAKCIETRSWATKYRGPLAIHASQKFPRWAKDLCFEQNIGNALLCARIWGGTIYTLEDLPLGCMVAVCQLVECEPILRPGWRYLDETIQPFTIPEEPERSFGDYTPGRYAWILANVQPLPRPIPAKGSLGLWEWNE